MELDVERIVRMVADRCLMDGEHVRHGQLPERVITPDDVAQYERERTAFGVVEIDQRRDRATRQHVRLVRVPREPRNAREEVLALADHPRPGQLALPTSASSERPERRWWSAATSASRAIVS